jgi:hypothetical protein
MLVLTVILSDGTTEFSLRLEISRLMEMIEGFVEYLGREISRAIFEYAIMQPLFPAACTYVGGDANTMELG